MTATVTAPARSRRALRIAAWAVVAVIAALVVSWLVAAKNPSLSPAGMSWQSDAFVVSEASEVSDEDTPTWIAWDQPDGAWASVVVKNDRPYAVTIAPGADSPGQKVQVDAFDPGSTETVMDPAAREALPTLQLAPGDQAIVSMRVSDRCMHMAAGSAIGSDTTVISVTTFGVTEDFEVQFPGTFMAGTTNGHAADQTCSGP